MIISDCITQKYTEFWFDQQWSWFYTLRRIFTRNIFLVVFFGSICTICFKDDNFNQEWHIWKTNSAHLPISFRQASPASPDPPALATCTKRPAAHHRRPGGLSGRPWRRPRPAAPVSAASWARWWHSHGCRAQWGGGGDCLGRTWRLLIAEIWDFDSRKFEDVDEDEDDEDDDDDVLIFLEQIFPGASQPSNIRLSPRRGSARSPRRGTRPCRASCPLCPLYLANVGPPSDVCWFIKPSNYI